MSARTEGGRGTALPRWCRAALIAVGVIAAGGLAAKAWAQSATVASVNVGSMVQISGPSPLGVADSPGESSIFTRRLSIAAAANARALQTALLSASVRKITVAFKLDPSLLGGTYGQVPWVSPRVYQGVRGQKTVEAKAGGIDSNGRVITYLVVKWIAENPTMVAVSPREASLVKITVRKPGTSKLRMVYGRLTKTLLIKAVSNSGLLQLWITQL